MGNIKIYFKDFWFDSHPNNRRYQKAFDPSKTTKLKNKIKNITPAETKLLGNIWFTRIPWTGEAQEYFSTHSNNH